MIPTIPRTALLLFALPLLGATMAKAADAQARSSAVAAEAAEAVVRSAFEALDARRWQVAAALMDPETLERFRAWKLDSARQQERLRNDPSVHRYGPETPPEVVAWFKEQRAKYAALQARFGAPFLHDFAGIESLEQLEALSAEELFARFLQGRDPREQLDRTMGMLAPDIPPEMRAIAEGTPRRLRTIVGSTVEDDSTVQVVYRTRLTPEEMGVPAVVSVLTVRQTPQGWRIWTGSHDRALFDENEEMAFASFPTAEEEQEQLRKLAETVTVWPLEGGGEGRAFAIGYTGGTEPPTAFAIEATRPDGTKTRVEIPSAYVPRVAEFLFAWPTEH